MSLIYFAFLAIFAADVSVLYFGPSLPSANLKRTPDVLGAPVPLPFPVQPCLPSEEEQPYRPFPPKRRPRDDDNPRKPGLGSSRLDGRSSQFA